MLRKIVVVRNGNHRGGILTKLGRQQSYVLARSIKVDVNGVAEIMSSPDLQVIETVKIFTAMIGVSSRVCERQLVREDEKVCIDSVARLILMHPLSLNALVIVSHQGYTSILPKLIFEIYGIKDEVGVIEEGEAGMFDLANLYSIKIQPPLGRKGRF